MQAGWAGQRGGEADGGAASYCVTDATIASDLDNLFARAGDLGNVTAVIFNVGNNQIIPFSELSAEQFEQFWRVCTLSAFLTAQAALPILEQNGGSLLFTGASASMRGRPNFAHFGSAKAPQIHRRHRFMERAPGPDHLPRDLAGEDQGRPP